MTVNIALRRQLHQLAYYTEGNVPEALIGTPESWTPQQIKEFQQYWDALLEGNLAQRRHAKFVPGGVAKTFIPTREGELKGAFDEWLARVVCFAFSISPQAFTDHMNRATAETAQAAALSEGLAPIQNWVKQLIDYLLITEFDAPDLEFAWRDEHEIDAQKLAGIAQIYVTHGIKTVNEARADIGLDPVEGGDTPLVFTGSGAVPLAQAAKGGNPSAGGAAAAKALAKYSPDQPRDERGRWTSEDSGSQMQDTSSPIQQAQEILIPGRTPFWVPRTGIRPRVKPRIPRQSGGAAADDIPDWARGSAPQEKGPRGSGDWENGKEYAKRLMDEKWGKGKWEGIPKREEEYNKLKKFGDRAFETPKDSLPPFGTEQDDGA
jgi:portal protein